MSSSSVRIHGGVDAQGAPRFDFSTNSNACGPCPPALAAVQQADATRYPDPGYTDLRAGVADFHGVDVARIVLAGSASEFIFRITAWVALQGRRKSDHTVSIPPHAFGDYAQAARAWGLGITTEPAQAKLVWCCEPSSPLGVAAPLPDLQPQAVVVLDSAYAPLRLSGASSFTDAQRAQVWQLFSPNKALGLTGVRAAYAIAPVGAEADALALDALAPSWPLGAQGVALLWAWVQADAQAWLAESLHTLRRWKAQQIAMLQDMGWTCLPSDANFFCAQPAQRPNSQGMGDALWVAELTRLRAAGIKLRDTASFGLPGHARLSVQPPVAQDVLRAALRLAAATPEYSSMEVQT
jgi:histidinol-phosphate aminotransferase